MVNLLQNIRNPETRGKNNKSKLSFYLHVRNSVSITFINVITKFQVTTSTHHQALAHCMHASHEGVRQPVVSVYRVSSVSIKITFRWGYVTCSVLYTRFMTICACYSWGKLLHVGFDVSLDNMYDCKQNMGKLIVRKFV